MQNKVYKPDPYKSYQQLRTAKLIRFTRNKEKGIKIQFPLNPKDLCSVKSLPGRKFHAKGNKKYWTVPFSLITLLMLYEQEFILDDRLKKLLRKYVFSSPKKNKPIKKIDGLKGDKLIPFQGEGISFTESKNGRALIADDMGLGKTIQALAWLQLHTDFRPVIIVVPASLKLNWVKEAQKWLNKPNIQVLYGTDTSTTLLGEIIVLNYDILPFWIDKLIQYKPEVLITDESHYFKNKSAKRTKAVIKLGKKCSHIIALSGTPIVNKPIEFYNVIHLINPKLFPNRWDFAHRYCDAKHNGFGWDLSGSSNEQELHQILTNTIMIRRTKKEVLKQLPDKIFSFIPMELDNQNEYDLAETDFIEFIKQQTENDLMIELRKSLKEEYHSFINIKDEKLEELKADKVSKINILTEIESLKQLAVKGKMKQAVNWIRDFLESGEKLVLFANHRFVIDQLMEEFKTVAVKIDGSVSQTNRQKAVDEFQTNKNIRLFVGNIKAAGVGLTLTASSNVGILELPWTPGDLIQAIDRCHRIGQKDTVNVYYLLAANTVEEEIAELLDKKQKILDAVLDGKETDKTSLLTELLKKYK